MKKSFITEVSIFFLIIEITDFGVPFKQFAGTNTELPQTSECLMSAHDFWPDTSAGCGT